MIIISSDKKYPKKENIQKKYHDRYYPLVKVMITFLMIGDKHQYFPKPYLYP